MMVFNNPVMKGSALFYPHAISARGEWYRFLTSGFIHADWMHLLVNMYVLYIFGDILEHYLLPLYFHQKTRLVYLAIYLGGMIVSDIPPISNTVTTVCTVHLVPQERYPLLFLQVF